MRRALPIFAVIAFLLSGATPLARAQQGDMAYFESFDGLQRIIARNWMAPLTMIETSETHMLNEEGTPIAGWREEPVSTPEPVTDATVGHFTAFVFLFDSDEHAATGFERIDDEMQETARRDLRAPMQDELVLDGIGDQAAGYMGDHAQDDITVTYAFATVQDGPFVYQLFAMTANVDPADVMRDAAETLIRQPMNRMAERFDPDGGSRGGLWSKLDSLHPDVPTGSDVIDLIIYPMPEATPGASPFPEAPRLDLDDPGSIAGLRSIDQARYVEAHGATPTPDVPGVFRIDAWVLTFDSTADAQAAAIPLGNALIAPFIIVTGGASSTSDDTSSAWYEGYIDDRSLPPGNGIVSILHFGESLYAVVVYAIDDDPHPVADAIMRGMTADSAIPPQDRLPATGDPVLKGLVPTAMPGPEATPDD